MTVTRIGHQYWIRVGTQLKSFHPSPVWNTDRDILELSSSTTHQSLASPSFGLAQLSLSLVTVILAPEPMQICILSHHVGSAGPACAGNCCHEGNRTRAEVYVFLSCMLSSAIQACIQGFRTRASFYTRLRRVGQLSETIGNTHEYKLGTTHQFKSTTLI